MTGPADEQCIALTRDFRLLQKRKGHRYSVDDMLVGQLAVTHWAAAGREPPRRVLDLGCGLGSVLLITAWALPDARLVGLETLDEHVCYARRNVALNRCGDRVQVVAGDLRDLDLVRSLGPFDLVTGSPPYFVAGTVTPPADPARAAAHIELRGGIEAYATAAAAALTPDGLFACCAPADPPARARQAFESAGLALRYHRNVAPRPNKPPFLKLLVGTLAPGPGPEEPPPLVLRRADGRRSDEQRAIREWTGL